MRKEEFDSIKNILYEYSVENDALMKFRVKSPLTCYIENLDCKNSLMLDFIKSTASDKTWVSDQSIKKFEVIIEMLFIKLK